MIFRHDKKNLLSFNFHVSQNFITADLIKRLTCQANTHVFKTGEKSALGNCSPDLLQPFSACIGCGCPATLQPP